MEFYYIINVILSSRLIYGFRDAAVSKRKIVAVLCFQLILLLIIKLSLTFFLFVIAVIFLDLFVYFSERKFKNLNAIRFVTFIIALLLVSFLTSPFANMEFSNGALKLIENIKYYFSPLSNIGNIDWLKFNIMLMGILILINETNYLIRYFFDIFNLYPLHKANNNIIAVDSKEYNAGRIIGMLERILIFFFLMADQYTAIGFVLAAKGFTRFKELDNRNFAEYVLIGTFFSSLSAIILALIIKTILSN